jgi:hypothetical protein
VISHPQTNHNKSKSRSSRYVNGRQLFFLTFVLPEPNPTWTLPM